MPRPITGLQHGRAEKSKRILPSFLADCHVVIQWQRYGFVQPEGPRRLFIFNHHAPPFILPIIIMCSCVSAPAGRLEKPEESVLSDVSPLSSGVDSGQQSPVSPENRKRERGIKKLWGRFVSQRVSVAASFFFFFCPVCVFPLGNDEALRSVLRIRRSQSGSPAQGHDPELGEFKRGGFRATAGPRLARSGNTR